MNHDDQYKQGYLAGMRAAIDACEATCGKWHEDRKTFPGMLVCPCAESIKKLKVPPNL